MPLFKADEGYYEMKVLVAGKDNGDTAEMKILIPFALRSCCFFSAFVSSLRFRLLFLCGVTVFMLVTVATYPLLDVQDVYPFLAWSKEMVSPSSPPPLPPSRSNYDILEYTAMDPSDIVEREKIKQLLDGSIDGARRFRYNWHENRLDRRLDHIDHLDAYERRPLLRRSRERWPPDLSNPRYVPYFTQFRQLLQSWARKKRYEPQIMKDLLPSLKDPIDRHYNAGGMTVDFGKPYRTCAVVGNSGILLNKTYGSFIDSHDMVMRLNNARISGFERWVGSKTTFSFVNSNILHSCARRLRCSCQSYGESVPVVSYICQVAHFMDVAYCGAFQKAPLLVTDPRFDSLSTRIIRYYSLKHFFEKTGKTYEEWNKLHDGALFHYSSGMQAVMLALGVCEKVDILGFGKLQDAKHHYHTNQKAELPLHDYEAEYIFYNDLVNRSASIPFLNESGMVLPPVDIFL